jgi:hypothetical protein
MEYMNGYAFQTDGIYEWVCFSNEWNHSYIPSVWKAYPFIYSICLKSIPLHIFHPFGKHTHSYIPSVWKAYPFI